MSVIRHNLKERLDRARISRYARQVNSQSLRMERAAAHVERAASGSKDYI